VVRTGAAIMSLRKNILQIAGPIQGKAWKEDRRLNGGQGGSGLISGAA